MLRFDVITIFPEFFREAIDCGIVRRARNAGIVDIKAHDLRQWTTDKHHVVDDRPFGGGDGMILKPEPIFTAAGHVFGSPPYMPPEQWTDAGSVDARADQYALAALAYEACTGTTPFVCRCVAAY